MHCLETLLVNLGQSWYNISRKHLEGDTDGLGPLPASPGSLIAYIFKIISKAWY